MKKRVFALLTVLAVLLFGMTALAEEDDFWDDDFFGDDDFFSDEDFYEDDGIVLPDFEEDDNQNLKDRMDALSGFSGIDFKQEGDFRFIVLEDGKSCATDRYLGVDTVVTVPEKLGGCTVTAIGEMTFQDCKVEEVILPETILSIDNMAFFKCESLRSITVPEGVTALGRCCFGGCTALQTAVLPESLETVDEFAFLNCAALSEACFGTQLKSIGPNAFCMCASLIRVVLPRNAQVDESAFTQCPEDRETEYI
ncbi:MAG: leucine-rich repeat domain-containing protein [Clostridia bacterium]|nr:leucine-rich repeat domain-containing protein [Clostridia bacterium]